MVDDSLEVNDEEIKSLAKKMEDVEMTTKRVVDKYCNMSAGLNKSNNIQKELAQLNFILKKKKDVLLR